ncbi:uncharacterized protein FFB20_13314 [Fusarium fujikuroi]|uniref:Uncharacterized protein n=1 Tax=Fusarium fujikuroi TaxID=5127 RepID=A0A9Q9RXP2_FUSFU|nr:uncharacterized protein FFB20_13314 [Fusarium fujikuroi]SCV26093.1 uncharacterized protein FFFS_00095 [Fusarium fujikuroi]VTT77347.1 unnamed protein product [Fusarium fujikuroi]
MQPPTPSERRQIVQTLFGNDQVPYAQSSRFDTYFKYYCSVVCPGSVGNAVLELNTPVLKSHSDVLKFIQALMQNPKISFDNFVSATVASELSDFTLTERRYIARVATQVSLGINCTNTGYRTDIHVGNSPDWRGDTPFLTFIESTFYKRASTLPEQQQGLTEVILNKKSLKAWKLYQRYGIEIKATDNLVEHLYLDISRKTLKVFHQVSFLRAHLEKTRHEPLDLGFEESLKRGTLPPRLLLETLVTFHDILFPVMSVRDTKSLDTLKGMIKKNGFDPEGRWIEFVRNTPSDMSFTYWGHRLTKLHDLVKRPPPANAIVAWFERHTSERNALTVAIIGVFLSVLFGFLSFLVGLLQLILAWVIYNHPTTAST